MKKNLIYIILVIVLIVLFMNYGRHAATPLKSGDITNIVLGPGINLHSGIIFVNIPGYWLASFKTFYSDGNEKTPSTVEVRIRCDALCTEDIVIPAGAYIDLYGTFEGVSSPVRVYFPAKTIPFGTNLGFNVASDGSTYYDATLNNLAYKAPNPCGNSVCDSGETFTTCPSDCPECSSAVQCKEKYSSCDYACVNNVCESTVNTATKPCNSAVWKIYPDCNWDTSACCSSDSNCGTNTCTTKYTCTNGNCNSETLTLPQKPCDSATFLEYPTCNYDSTSCNTGCTSDANCPADNCEKDYSCSNNVCVSTSKNIPTIPCSAATWKAYPDCKWDNSTCVTSQTNQTSNQTTVIQNYYYNTPEPEVEKKTITDYLKENWLIGVLVIGILVLIFKRRKK